MGPPSRRRRDLNRTSRTAARKTRPAKRSGIAGDPAPCDVPWPCVAAAVGVGPVLPAGLGGPVAPLVEPDAEGLPAQSTGKGPLGAGTGP